MIKEHKKLYKAGKNWVTATISVAAFTLLSGIGAHKVQADTMVNNQTPQETSVDQAQRVTRPTNAVSLGRSISEQNNVQNEQHNIDNQTGVTPAVAAFATSSNSDALDPSIYGTVNVKDWDYQKGNNIINLTGYHGQDRMHVTIPNLNDFAKYGIKVDGIDGIGLSSTVASGIAPQEFEHDEIGQQIYPSLAISKTHGAYNDKVIATDSDWSGVFANPYVLHIDLTNLDTSHITNMSRMFESFASHRHAEEIVGLNNWDTSHVVDMSNMFHDSAVGKVEISDWNTHNVINMSSMLANGPRLVGDLSNWDTRNVTNMRGMFAAGPESVGDLSKWNTHNVTDMSNMFEGTYLRTVGDIGNWDIGNVTNMSNMFGHEPNISFPAQLQTVGDLSRWDTHNVTDMGNMFALSKLQTVGDLGRWNTHNVTNMSNMFEGASLRTVGDLGNWDTGKVTNMSSMFASDLQSVGDLSRWDTHNVTNMSGMFGGTSFRTVGDLSNWDISNVTTMSYMFHGAKLQTVGNIGNWDTSNVTDMSHMFEEAGFLTVEGIDNWNTSNVTNMSEMFEEAKLQTIGDIGNWDTHNVTNMNAMFKKMPNLVKMDLSRWDTSNVVDMDSMFEGSGNLQTVGDIGKWDTSSVVEWQWHHLNGMFADTHLPYFCVSSSQDDDAHYYRNQVRLVDSNGLMGQAHSTITFIRTPTFYKQISGKTEEDSVVATITPIVEKEANRIYQQFRSNLTKGMQLIYPTEISLKRTSYSWNPSALANAIFDYDMKIGTLKNVVINYVDKTGNVVGDIVGSEIMTGTIGSTLPLPKKLSLPSGYQLVRDQEIPTSVTIKKGRLQTIDIYVEKTSEASTTKTGTIVYVDPDGKTVKTDQLKGKVGEKVNVKISLPDGYELANKDEQLPSTVTVTEDGIKTITIQVQEIPGVKTGSIVYVDPDGKTVKTDQLKGKVGEKVNIKISLPNGYELANKDEQLPSVVTVTADGIKTITIRVKKFNTDLAENEVPYDTNTVFNRVDANYGYLDNYKITEDSQGQTQIIASGWHVSGASNQSRYRYVIVYDDTLGHEIARQKLAPQARPDVRAAYSYVVNSGYSGFNIQISIPNYCINHSLRLISRYSNNPGNGEGANFDFWFSPLVINRGNQANLDSVQLDSKNLLVNGWHATNQAAGRPYHYIIIWDRNLGHEVARQKVFTLSRPDVAKVYNTVANAGNSGFSASFSLIPQFSDSIQIISRWTDDANGNGNAVDYWFAPQRLVNDLSNQAYLDTVSAQRGYLHVSGWHATNRSIGRPYHTIIVLNASTGKEMGRYTTSQLVTRSDVARAFPNIRTAEQSGFSANIKLAPGMGNQPIQIISRWSANADANSNYVDYWFKPQRLFNDTTNHAWLDDFSSRGDRIHASGWNATSQSLGRENHYIILFDQTTNREVQRVQVDLNQGKRPDVANVYPGSYNALYSGFDVNFRISANFVGHKLSILSRWTNDPAGNGNAVDHWFDPRTIL